MTSRNLHYDLTDCQLHILNALTDEPKRHFEVARDARCAHQTARKHLPFLVRKGLARKTRRGYIAVQPDHGFCDNDLMGK